jgi:hypothetical protein
MLLSDASVVSIITTKHASETDPIGAGRGQFTLRRTGSSSGDLHVSIRISPGSSTATVGEDYESLPKVVRIPAGRHDVHVSLPPIDDHIGEPRELVTIKVMPAAGYTISPTRPAAKVWITDNEPSVGIFSTRSIASEADPAGAGRGEFIVKRAGSTAAPLLVRYYVRHTSTAVSGLDFEPLSGEVSIPAGQSTAKFSLRPIDDDLAEPNETVVLTLRHSSGYWRFPHSATVSIIDNDASRPGWWSDAHGFRVPLRAAAGPHQRIDAIVEHAVNFTGLLTDAGASGLTLVENSLRLVETTADGLRVLDENVPFQFDREADYHAGSNAAGTIVFLMKGRTAAGQARHYHVYFDNAGTFSAARFASRVTVTDNVPDEGYPSIRIQSESATYFYQKSQGGFSSILDADGNDWINWNATPGSAGEYRGVPNLGPVGFHPGRNHDLTTRITSQGPLKAAIHTTDSRGNRVRWEFFPSHARATILSMDQNYYFLYEGTPGGSIDSNDFVVRSSGERTGIGESWSGLGADANEQWVYFGDAAANRFFYLAHHEADELEDSYFNLDNRMTVFGFGRRNNPGAEPTRLLTATPNTFTIGLGAGGAFADARLKINGAYQFLASSGSAPQSRA